MRRGGGDNPQAAGPRAYFFGEYRVAGLQYQYENGGGGETNARGGFPIEQGKTVVFSVGQTRLGTLDFSSDAERDIVTPSRIVGDSGDQTARETRALRVERLLSALDADASDSVINIPAAALTSTVNLLGIGQLAINMTAAATVSGMSVDGLTLNILGADETRLDLMFTNNCAYSGSFAGRTSNGNTVAFVLMPTYYGGLTVAGVVTLANASPAISFIRDDSGVRFDEAILTVDLKIPPLEVALGGGTMTLVSYDRIEFGGGTIRRVAGDPNADIRFVGVYSEDDEKGPFVADISSININILTAQQGVAEISDIRDPNFRNLLSATWMGMLDETDPEMNTSIWTLRENILDNSVTLTVSPSLPRMVSPGGLDFVGRIFESVSDGRGGIFC